VRKPDLANRIESYLYDLERSFYVEINLNSASYLPDLVIGFEIKDYLYLLRTKEDYIHYFREVCLENGGFRFIENVNDFDSFSEFIKGRIRADNE
jgi:hypothetical protein